MRFGLLVSAVVLIGGFVFWKDISHVVTNTTQPAGTEKSKKQKKDANETPLWADISVTQKWELPAILKEVSGIEYLDADRFACIQDEQGSIFIFNTATKKIEKEILFGAPGDYEDLAFVGNTAWAVQSNGTLFEIDLNGNATAAKQYKTPLTADHNIEGLEYDKKKNQLLLAIKGAEPGNKLFKGIYAFNLATKTLAAQPVLQISLRNDILKTSSGKKDKGFHPSAIGIHPQTNDIYITDGTKSTLLVMDASGKIKKLVQLGKDFEQPEGIAFSADGKVFISNEGSKNSANIIQVQIN